MLEIDNAIEILGSSRMSLMVMACLIKKRTGKHPNWYIVRNREIYIDTKILIDNTERRHKEWQYATETLYYKIKDLDNVTMIDVARYLAKNTVGSVNSWAIYLSRDMFVYPTKLVYETKRTKLNDFVQYGKEFLELHNSKSTCSKN